MLSLIPAGLNSSPVHSLGVEVLIGAICIGYKRVEGWICPNAE